MTKREIAGLTIKLMGVWLFIKSLTMVPFGIGNLITLHRSDVGSYAWTIVYMSLGWAVSIVLPLLIIVFSDKCAGLLIRDDRKIEWSGAIQKSDVLAMAFAIVGLFLILTGIPNLILQLTQLQIRGHYSQSGGLSQAAYLVAPVVQIGLGVWLFAGARGIAMFWERIRGFGLKQV